MIHPVPVEFRPKHPLKYPPDNHVEFERWFHQNYKPKESMPRWYLPIYWTNYYCVHGYGTKRRELDQLQDFINRLPDKKYFTICQYDDGIINDLSKKDIRVYSMSGRPMDYALPLICQPHNVPYSGKKDIFCNYVGRTTHPIRKELLKINQAGYYISDRSHNMSKFCSILARSTFTLCPRGYGPTSFRIQEALQFGSIPVYISDKFIIPHKVPFNEYGVLIRPEQIPDIPKILADIDPKSKDKEAYKKYFTYEANLKLITDDLRYNSSLQK